MAGPKTHSSTAVARRGGRVSSGEVRSLGSGSGPDRQVRVSTSLRGPSRQSRVQGASLTMPVPSVAEPASAQYSRRQGRHPRALSPVALLAIGALLTAALAQPFPSMPIDTVRWLGPDIKCSKPRVASSDTMNYVVWMSDGHIKGCRIGPSMRLLDSVPLPVSGLEFGVRADLGLDVAATDSGFLAIWQDYDVILAAVVDRTGRVVSRIRLDSLGQHQGFAAARAGTEYVVAWSCFTSTTHSQVSFARVGTDGTIGLRGRVAAATEPPADIWGADVASADERTLVVWHRYDYHTGYQEIYGQILVPDSVPTDTVGFPICSRTTGLVQDVCFNGESFFVAWTEYKGDTQTVRVTRVSPEGVVLDSTGIQAAPDGVNSVSAASCGDTTMLAWVGPVGDSNSAIFGLRVDRDIRPLDSLPAMYSDSTGVVGVVSVAGSQGVFSLAWSQGVSGATVMGRRVGSGGGVLDSAPVLVSYAANRQMSGNVASDGQNFLAVWAGGRTDSVVRVCIKTARFDRQGRLLDSAPGALSFPHIYANRIAVAFGGGCYLVCWDEKSTSSSPGGDIWAVRINSDGILLDTVPIRIEDGPHDSYRVDVAYGDDVFVLVFQYRGRIGAVRITPSGVVLDSLPVRINVAEQRASRLRIASDGEGFLVSFFNVANTTLWAALLNSDLSVANSVLLTDKSAVGEVQLNVAFGCNRYFVIGGDWSKAWVLSQEGQVMDSTDIIRGSRMGYWFATVFDGTHSFTVAVDNQRERVLHGMRLSSSCELVDSVPIPVCVLDSAYLLGDCGVASDSMGTVAVVFTAYEPYGYMSTRVRLATFPAIAGVLGDAGFAGRTSMSIPSPVRHSLSLPGRSGAVLFDITGTRVASLQPGENDIRHVSPGVYFVRVDESSSAAKVVVSR